MISDYRKRIAVTACSLALLPIGALAAKQTQDDVTGNSARIVTQADRADAKAAQFHIGGALRVLHQLEADAKMKPLLQHAKGVFIIPTYGEIAAVVGGEGGPGVLLVRQDNTWSHHPVFYTAGGVSVGLQVGVKGGPVAFVLNTDKALDKFRQDNNFALSGDAGLAVANWSKLAEGIAGNSDVVTWSSARGLFAGAAIALDDIHFDKNENAAYYRQTVVASDVIDGRVRNPHSPALNHVVANSSSGTSGSSRNTESKKPE